MPSHAYVSFYQKLMSRVIPQVLPVDEMRKNFEDWLLSYPESPNVHLENVSIDTVPCLWVIADNAPKKKVILFFHGGGFVSGSSFSHRDLMGRLSTKSHTPVLGVDFRKSPEHPFPAALHDAEHVYKSLLSNGHSPHDIALVGCSAGAGLAIALIHKLKKEGQMLPSAVVCVAPWVDMSLSGESYQTNRGKDLVSMERMIFYKESYLHNHSPKDPLASPIEGDFSGFPPLFIQTGTNDLLYSDAQHLYKKSLKSDVDVSLDEWRHMVHSFALFAKDFPEADEAIERIASFLKPRLS